jgi:hypothetical protein
MVLELAPKIIDAFDNLRKIYLLQGFENRSMETEDILRSNLDNKEYLMSIKSRIELIIESQLEEHLNSVDDFFALPNLKEELNIIQKYLLTLLKGDPDVENVKCFIIFNPISGIVKFGWNHQIFKKDIDLVIGLFTAITSFSKEAIERQLKGLSVEGMEFKMLPFDKSDLAILFILERNPSPLLDNRLNTFTNKIEKNFLELFEKMDFIDFTDDAKVVDKISEMMIEILKFEQEDLENYKKKKD